MPKLHRSANGGFVSSSNGSQGCYGGWELAFEVDESLEPIVASVRVQWADLARGWDSFPKVLCNGSVPTAPCSRGRH